MLEPGRGGIYVDATVGLGGHAEEILKLIGPEGRLIGIDRDDEALKMAKERLGDSGVVLMQGKFSAGHLFIEINPSIKRTQKIYNKHYTHVISR